MRAIADLPSRRALVEVPPPTTGPTVPVVRRYRLERLQLLTRPDPTLDRFAHLRKSYD